MESSTEKEDISEKLFGLCAGLEVGELVTAPNFKLGDVMSAIELLEPKMDVGVGTHTTLSLEEAISRGMNSNDLPMQLAIFDATLATIVGWLEGSSLASTVWTNVLLAEVKNIPNPTFRSFAAGVNLLVRNIHSIINSVGNLEELPEDFNPQMIFMTTKWAPRHIITQHMRAQIQALTILGNSFKPHSGVVRSQQICYALGVRLEMVVLLLDTIGQLVPPEIEDPNFDHKIHMGNYTIHEREVCATDGNDNGEKSGAPAPPDINHVCESGLCQAHAFDDDEELEEDQFKPNFPVSNYLVERLISACKAFAETVKFGTEAPNGVDGDFTWLPVFDPKACVRLIPACFPRSVNIPSRDEAAQWFVSFAYRLQDLCITTPSTVKDLNNLFYFARTFNLRSCVLTRSLLQIAMFPIDNHLCGDSKRTAADPIEVSLKVGYSPQVLMKDSAVYPDMIAQNLYVTFLNHMTKQAINVYSSFGMNLSRQRDRLEVAIEELGQLQAYVGELETRTDQLMIDSKTVDDPEMNPSYHSVSSFVFHNQLAIMHHYFELGFRMDLFVPYEYTYIYWYMGNRQARWMLSTLERSYAIQDAIWKADPLSTTVNPRKKKARAMMEEETMKRLAVCKFSINNHRSIVQICAGVVKLSVLLIRMGKVKMPPGGQESERLRFERRFEPFEPLGPPMRVTYDDFLEEAEIDVLMAMDMNDLMGAAAANFTEALRHVQELNNVTEQNKETIELERVAKFNMLACSVLRMGKHLTEFEWEFTDDFPVLPTLRVASHERDKTKAKQKNKLKR
ncbi:unnamed protein product [Caenorhabditis sp. 36 PRJEB53466]|nr:unnamed protein product [Caenorhabditis sp. 36 PRJEB53466]